MSDARLTNPVAGHIGYRLRRASVQVMAGAATSIAHLGLHLTPATILLLIDANPGCRQSDLCVELGMKRANMTPIIADLAARGWIDRAAIDGRSMALRLTEGGLDAAQATAAALDANEARLAGAMTSGRLTDLLATLVQLERIGESSVIGTQAA